MLVKAQVWTAAALLIMVGISACSSDRANDLQDVDSASNGSDMESGAGADTTENGALEINNTGEDSARYRITFNATWSLSIHRQTFQPGHIFPVSSAQFTANRRSCGSPGNSPPMALNKWPKPATSLCCGQKCKRQYQRAAR